MKLVLDSNVLLAAFAARGLCADLFSLVLSQHELLISEPLLREVKRNLAGKIKLPKQHVDDIVEYLRTVGVPVTPAPVSVKARWDRSDLHVLGLAEAGEAECLITGDEDLLVLGCYRSIEILSPRDFWRRCRGIRS